MWVGVGIVFGFQIPRFPDAAAGTTAPRLLRSQSDPSPDAHRDEIRCKEPGAFAAIILILSQSLIDELRLVPNSPTQVDEQLGNPRFRSNWQSFAIQSIRGGLQMPARQEMCGFH